jgi:micrococcal nuclease
MSRLKVVLGVIVGIIILVAIVGYFAINNQKADISEEQRLNLPLSPISGIDCSGTAQCITGTLTKIIDGDTLLVDDQSVRFALSSAPELKGFGGVDVRDFVETLCPVGSTVTVDEDDGQIIGSYGRMVGVVYCGDVNLNKEILDANLGYLEIRFCDSSEFAGESWAIKHGCPS